jgi:CheY-like chemotaxis protein
MPAEVILIVDDDPISLAVAKLVLAHSGFAVQTAGDGPAALELLQTLQPDVILSDIQMPRMDGYELARRVREIPRLRETPMIALTAFATKASEQSAYAAGFTDYMTKPVNTTGLAAAIRTLLERAA